MSSEKMRIVHITDLHFYHFPIPFRRLFNKRLFGYWNAKLNRVRKFDFSRVEQFMKYLVDNSIENVVITGDVSTTADEEEFKKAGDFFEKLVGLGIKVFLIPGNHDYYTFESVRRKRFEKMFEKYMLLQEYPISLNLSDGTPLILLHTARANLLSSRGKIDSSQIVRLKTLIENLDRPAIIACHYPILQYTPEYYSSPFRRLINAKKLRSVLLNTKVPILYLAGHVHHYSLEKDTANSMLTYLCTPPLFYSPNKKGGFCEISVFEDRFEVKLKKWID